MSYTWTDDTMKSGTPCDVDKVADNLMHLKYEHVPQLNTPNSINSGVVDSSGDADILSYSGNVVSFDTSTPITITTADKKSSVFTSVSSVTIPTVSSATFNIYMGHNVSTMTLSQKFAESVKSQVTNSSINGLYDFGSVASGTVVPDLSGNGYDIELSQDASTLQADNASGLDFSKGNGDYWAQTALIASGKNFYGLCKLQNGEYLATEITTGYVYASNDKITWTQRALIEASTYLREITQLANGTVVAVSASGKIYKSTDNGLNWDSGLTVYAGSSGICQLSNGDVLVTAATRVYKSTDNAASFPTYAAPSGANVLAGICQTPDDDVLACDYVGDKIYRSTNDGTTFDNGTSLTGSSIYDPSSIVVNQDNDIIISHAITNGGSRVYVSKSTDGGYTFQSYKSTGISSGNVCQFMLDNNHLHFACTNNYIYTSVATWTIPDNDDMSFGNGATDSPFSLLWNGKLNYLGGNFIAKYSAAEREFYFSVDSSSRVGGNIIDNSSTGALRGRYDSTGYTSNDLGEQKCLTFMYNANGSYTGIKLYEDITRIDDSSLYNAYTYTAMENLGQNVGNYGIDPNGYKAGIGGQIVSNVAIIGEELSTLQLANIYNSRIDIEMYPTDYTIGKAFPASPVADDVHFLTSIEPAILYKYTGSAWAEYNKVLCGQAITDGSGNVTSIVQPAYNQNGYDINSNTDEGSFPNFANGTTKSWDTVYYADCNGWLKWGSYTYSSGAQTYYHVGLTSSVELFSLNLCGISNAAADAGGILPITKGYYYKFTGGANQSLVFFPAQGVS